MTDFYMKSSTGLKWVWKSVYYSLENISNNPTGIVQSQQLKLLKNFCNLLKVNTEADL